MVGSERCKFMCLGSEHRVLRCEGGKSLDSTGTAPNPKPVSRRVWCLRSLCLSSLVDQLSPKPPKPKPKPAPPAQNPKTQNPSQLRQPHASEIGLSLYSVPVS